MARRYRKTLTAERLRELLHYDPSSGIFTWRVDRGVNKCKGNVAGTPDGGGHLMIRVDYRIYKAHRLAWLYMTGAWPSALIDHKDHDKSNNRWTNIREADDRRNMWNGRSKQPKSGHRGIQKLGNKFAAFIYEGKRGICLGRFDELDEAITAHANAVSQRGEFACLDMYKD